MSEKVDEKAYSNMIATLANFAKQLTDNMDTMQSLASTCGSVLGEEDTGAAAIIKQIGGCRLKYLKIAKRAVLIAQQMQKELDASKQEKEVWESED